MSCVKDYEIDLRGEHTASKGCLCQSCWLLHPILLMQSDSGCMSQPAGHKLSAIENLGATEVGWSAYTSACQASSCAHHKKHSQSIAITVEPVQNQFDSLDLSDNVISRIEGFPKLPRLKTLLLNNNRVTRIARNLEGKLVAAPCN